MIWDIPHHVNDGSRILNVHYKCVKNVIVDWVKTLFVGNCRRWSADIWSICNTNSNGGHPSQDTLQKGKGTGSSWQTFNRNSRSVNLGVQVLIVNNIHGKCHTPNANDCILPNNPWFKLVMRYDY